MKRDILKFTPLLILYIFLVILFSSTSFEGDEGGYVGLANSLLQGYASLKEATLWWGLGYPLVLTPFILLKLTWFWAKIFNGFFLFGSIIYFYNTVNIYIDKKYATIISFCLGLYPHFLIDIYKLYTESLVYFLISGFLFHFCKLYRKHENARFHLLIASFYLGYLALTKIFFGYVILAGLILFLIFLIWQNNENTRKTVFVYLFALILCIPYLLHTYSRTGKIFYWGTSGGMSLYWMSTSYNKDELGSWFSFKDVRERPELSSHRDFFNKLIGLSDIELDESFKKQAIENIIQDPVTYFINWIANLERMVFSQPYSYRSQKIYILMLPNMFIFVPFIVSIYPAILKRKDIPFEINALMIFFLIAFSGTSLVSAYDRQIRPLVPIVFLWLSFIYLRVLRIEIRSEIETQV